jgi:hypothetical protein
MGQTEGHCVCISCFRTKIGLRKSFKPGSPSGTSQTFTLLEVTLTAVILKGKGYIFQVRFSSFVSFASTHGALLKLGDALHSSSS